MRSESGTVPDPTKRISRYGGSPCILKNVSAKAPASKRPIRAINAALLRAVNATPARLSLRSRQNALPCAQTGAASFPCISAQPPPVAFSGAGGACPRAIPKMRWIA
jgi:hypothetical protein